MGNANEGSSMTQIDAARAGTITREMAIVAEKEGRDPEFIREGVAAGRIAIPANIHHTSLSPEGVGGGLRTKVNVNLGISGDVADEAEEWKKVDVALELGAEAIMDLSNTGKTHAFRSALIEKSPAMIGTVPMYDAIGYLEKPLITITVEDFLDVVRAHAEDGVDFVTIHAGMNRRTIESFQRDGPPHEHREPRRVAHLRVDGGHRQREPLLRVLRRGAGHPARARRDHQPGRCHAARLHVRRHRRGADRRAHRDRQAHEARMGRGRAGDGGRPRAYGAR